MVSSPAICRQESVEYISDSKAKGCIAGPRVRQIVAGAGRPRPGYRLEFDVDRFDLGIELDRMLAEFAANTGLLVATERLNRVDIVIAVDPYGSRL